MLIAIGVTLGIFFAAAMVLMHGDVKYTQEVLETLSSLNRKMLVQAAVIQNPEASPEAVSAAMAKASVLNSDFDSVMAEMRDYGGGSAISRLITVLQKMAG